MAHGYLLDQFLSPFSNQRNDEFGGDPKKRLRAPLEVLKAVRKIVGNDFPIICRVSADEFVQGGLEARGFQAHRPGTGAKRSRCPARLRHRGGVRVLEPAHLLLGRRGLRTSRRRNQVRGRRSGHRGGPNPHARNRSPNPGGEKGRPGLHGEGPHRGPGTPFQGAPGKNRRDYPLHFLQPLHADHPQGGRAMCGKSRNRPGRRVSCSESQAGEKGLGSGRRARRDESGGDRRPARPSG